MEGKNSKKEKWTERTRAEKAIVKTKFQSVPASPTEMELSSQFKRKSLPFSPSRVSVFSLYQVRKKKKYYPTGGKVCHVDRQAMGRDLFTKKSSTSVQGVIY